MRRRRKPLQVTMFPFLAVLLCAMGALILVLLVMDRRSKQAAQQRAQEEASRMLDDQVHALAERRNEYKTKERVLRQVWEKKRDALLARVGQEESALQAELRLIQARLAKAAQRVDDEEGNLTKMRKELQNQQAKLLGQQQALAEARKDAAAMTARMTSTDQTKVRLAGELVQLEKSLKELQEARQRDAQTYSVIPYFGKHGESRRPLYVECAGVGLIFHPDKLHFDGSINPQQVRNELQRRAAIQTARMKEAGAKDTRPYIMLLVRPDGIHRYYMMQAILRALGMEYGYEFVDADWILQVPTDSAPPPTQLASIQSPRPGVAPWASNSGTGGTKTGFFGDGSGGNSGAPGGGGPGGGGNMGNRADGSGTSGPGSPWGGPPGAGVRGTGPGVPGGTNGFQGASGNGVAGGPNTGGSGARVMGSGPFNSGAGIPGSTGGNGQPGAPGYSGLGGGTFQGGPNTGGSGARVMGSGPFNSGAGISGSTSGNGQPGSSRFDGSPGGTFPGVPGAVGQSPGGGVPGSGNPASGGSGQPWGAGLAGAQGGGNSAGAGLGTPVAGVPGQAGGVGPWAPGNGNPAGGSGAGTPNGPSLLPGAAGLGTADPGGASSGAPGFASGTSTGQRPLASVGAPQPYNTDGSVNSLGSSPGTPGGSPGNPSAAGAPGTGGVAGSPSGAADQTAGGPRLPAFPSPSYGSSGAAGGAAGMAGNQGSSSSSPPPPSRNNSTPPPDDGSARPSWAGSETKINPALSVARGGVNGGERSEEVPPFAPESPPVPSRKPPVLRPARLGSDGQFVIYIECLYDHVVIYPARRQVGIDSLNHSPNYNPLLKTVEQMIARRTSMLHDGEKRPHMQLRFLVHRDGERTLHLAYPALDAVQVEKVRYTLQPEDKVERIISAY